MTGGYVYLVGAGPGDLRLLTLRAFELLRSAEVVAHHELVSAEVLALAPNDAEILNVGHRGGHGPIIPALGPFVLECTGAGKKVVGLKCGDPLCSAVVPKKPKNSKERGFLLKSYLAFLPL